MAAPSIPNWQRVLAAMLGVQDTPGVNTFLTDWQHAEGGGAENNPFNTTEPGFGSIGRYNSVGVQRYNTPQHGLQATAATLKNGRYGNILAAMRAGKNPMAMASALANSPWGTGSLVERMLGGSPAGSSSGRTPPSEVGSGGSTPSPAANLPAVQQALASLLMGSGKVDFNSNQVQAPNLMALAQLRQAAGAQEAPTTARTLASGRRSGTTVLPAAGLPFSGNTVGVNPGFMTKLSAAAHAVGATQIRVTSGRRSAQHNAAVGGVGDSNHLTGHAVDGDAYIPGRGWVPLGVALQPVVGKFGLRSGNVAGFFNGGPDPVHVDDGYNLHH